MRSAGAVSGWLGSFFLKGKNMKLGALLAFAFAGWVAIPLSAQTPGGARVTFVVSGGGRLPSEWVNHIEDGMIAGSLNGDPCGNVGEIFCSAAPQPHDDEDLPTYSFEATFQPSSSYELSLQVGVAHPGSVSGYFDGGIEGLALTDAELRLEPQTVTIAASVRYIATGAVHIGGGPALHLNRVTAVSLARELVDTKAVPGFVLDATAAVPVRSTFFVQLATRYRWMKSTRYGPYDAFNMNGDALASFPATSAAFNALVAELGLGFRIR